MVGKIIAVVSGKGGTGKTSFTAAVSLALAKQGKRVLAIDMDIGMKNLDLSLGMSDRVMMDFSDVVFQRCQLREAAVPHPLYPHLYLLTAPLYHQENLSPEGILPLLESAGRLFDFVFLDAPAGLGQGFRLATVGAKQGVVIATHDHSSLRDARRAVEELAHLRKVQLVMNRVQPKVLKKLHFDLDDAMDQVGLSLLGVVPEDPKVSFYANQGKLVTAEGKQGAGKAYENIALRLAGTPTPLLKLR